MIEQSNTHESVFQKVVQVVADKVTIAPEKLTGATTLKDSGVDSLDMVEIIIELEDLFGIQIDDEKAAHISTLQELVDYIDELVERKK